MPPIERKQTALEDLGTLVRQRDELERDIMQAVASALTASASWTEIGKALGMSRAEAERRYRHRLVEERIFRVRED
jgi:DNA-binding Lrp family transcriptional regulator